MQLCLTVVQRGLQLSAERSDRRPRVLRQILIHQQRRHEQIQPVLQIPVQVEGRSGVHADTRTRTRRTARKMHVRLGWATGRSHCQAAAVLNFSRLECRVRRPRGGRGCEVGGSAAGVGERRLKRGPPRGNFGELCPQGLRICMIQDRRTYKEKVNCSNVNVDDLFRNSVKGLETSRDGKVPMSCYLPTLIAPSQKVHRRPQRLI